MSKLGHCRDCPHYRFMQPTLIRRIEMAPGCPPTHADGTPHNFDWATYADERQTHGVCYCGLSSVDLDLLLLP